MNGRAIPGAYLFRLYVCDKEMSWSHHIGETHQPDWVVYVRDSEKKREVQSTLDKFFDFSFSKETEASYWRREDLPWINFENLEEE
jgi:hypothetical protein